MNEIKNEIPIDNQKLNINKNITTPIKNNDEMNMIQDMKIDGDVDNNLQNLRDKNVDNTANALKKKHGTCNQCIIF